MDAIDDILFRGVANIIPNKEYLEKQLRSDKKLNIYLGIDPTATHIHLGHAVPLRKLQKFADLGHNVTFLIGDFTALIGDTSDKDTERPVLTSEQIKENFQTYKTQAEKIVDFSKVSVKYNSEWLKELKFEEIVKLAQHFSVGDFVGRELIRRRLDENKKVGLHEVLYPIMQGYDSYFMDTDIQLGGTDQTFNMQAGRTLQKDLRNKESYVMTNVFLEGTDGRKMSKSWGNAIWLDDSPEDMYAKVMAIKDELIIQYFTLTTDTPIQEIQVLKEKLEHGEHPMELKKQLARTITTELYSENEAHSAQAHFEKTVQGSELPSELQVVFWSSPNVSGPTIVDALVDLNFASSRSEGKTLTEQGGVSLNDERITDPNATFNPKENDILRVGKRRIVKIRTS
jgi:tyrosyl-tRNA synthetase